MAEYLLYKLNGKKKWEEYDSVVAPSRRRAVHEFHRRHSDLRVRVELVQDEVSKNLVKQVEPGIAGRWKVRLAR